jgi:hypothetical protein
MVKEDLRGRACIPFPCGFEDSILNKSMTLLIKKMKKLKNKLQKQKVKCPKLLNLISIKESPDKRAFLLYNDN